VVRCHQAPSPTQSITTTATIARGRSLLARVSRSATCATTGPAGFVLIRPRPDPPCAHQPTVTPLSCRHIARPRGHPTDSSFGCDLHAVDNASSVHPRLRLASTHLGSQDLTHVARCRGRRTQAPLSRLRFDSPFRQRCLVRVGVLGTDAGAVLDSIGSCAAATLRTAYLTLNGRGVGRGITPRALRLPRGALPGGRWIDGASPPRGSSCLDPHAGRVRLRHDRLRAAVHHPGVQGAGCRSLDLDGSGSDIIVTTAMLSTPEGSVLVVTDWPRSSGSVGLVWFILGEALIGAFCNGPS
jgi:hypothetical protein